jgi:1-deoxy-D-xylulose-5-phosphate reductoisomerase
MRLPIALGLSWPDRLDDVASPPDWSVPQSWTFEPLDEETFPAIRVARAALAASELHPAVFNAANEECVAAFLAGRLPFVGIVETVAGVVADHEGRGGDGTLSLADVLEAESWAREQARHRVGAGTGTGRGAQGC